jgi:hypothetical protein
MDLVYYQDLKMIYENDDIVIIIVQLKIVIMAHNRFILSPDSKKYED